MDALADLIGDSPAIVALRSKVERLLRSAAAGVRLPPLLLQGETGTGKGLLARSVHRASPRRDGPFVDINCAAIPETLLESELFGFERGAFTDARQAKPGLFEVARHGSLFLDEIGLIPEAVQAKLLKVLEDRTVRRLGATRGEPVDVWVIAATSEDLAEGIVQRRFRRDLYHRLAVIPLALPPLRARGSDVVRLAAHFLTRLCREYGVPEKSLADDAIAAIRAHRWPGNVRELANVMERVALLTDATVVTAAMLGVGSAPVTVAMAAPTARVTSGPLSREERQRTELRDTLVRTNWNVTRAASALGITRNTVRARIEKYGLRMGAEASGPSPDYGRREALRTVVPLRWESRRLTLLRIRFAGGADAELASRRLFDLIRDKIRGFGGRIEGPSPTGLFAVFGVDGGDEPSVRAAHAAIAVERTARQYAPGLPLWIGLHVTEIPVGVGTKPEPLDPDAARDAWTAVELLLKEREPGTIVATLQAAAFLRRRVSLRPLDPDADTYQIEGPAWVQRTSQRASGRFVGRSEELLLLESRFKYAAQGRGHVVNVAGEAGIGKTRLLQELLRRLPREAAVFLEGHCLPVAATTPFFPLIPIVKMACGITDADAPETMERRVFAALADSGLPAEDLAPDLGRLLGSQPDRPSPILAELMKRRLFGAVRALLLARATKVPVVLLVEDLHWVDHMSEACLASLVEALDTSAVLLVVTYRSGYAPPWLGRPNASQLTLSPLLPDESLVLVQGLVGAGTLADRILSRGEGNPLFLEELSRAALENRGALPERVPATLEEAVAARLGRVAPRARAVLNTAAVIGREVPLRLLRRVVDLGDGALDDVVDHLQRAEFLMENRGRSVEPGCTFKHALVQEVTYARIPPGERRSLHVRILDAAEALYADRLNERVESLAHHAVLGEAHERAVRYLLQAARKAAARSALADTISHARRGLELIPALPESAGRDGLELGLQVWLGLGLETTRGFAAVEVAEAHGRARELCQRVEGGPLLLGALGGLWFFYHSRGDYVTAREVVEQHRAVVERIGERNRLCASYSALGYTSYRVGFLVEARRELETSIDLYETYPRPEGTSLTPLDIGVSAEAGLPPVVWSLGYPDLALEHSRKAVDRCGRLVERFAVAFSLAWAHNAASRIHLLRREPELAAHHCRLAIEIGSEHGYPYPVTIAQVDLAMAEIGRGALADGIRTLRTGLDAWRAAGLEVDRSYLLAALADAHRLHGDFTAARVAVDEALAHVARHGERFYEAELYRLRGEIEWARTGHVDAAVADFERALETARAQRARMLELRAVTSLCRLPAPAGRAARAALAAVVATFTEGFETRDLVDARVLLQS
ncbi:MAG: sigma 54-interacting transcriptional regulator [Candidatus Rokubacteria bacterium]|nr:sigma 54-interacting transcriptional regulator [Candidatus Rokubacteria bacterium]